jgi:hypothetical protein
MLLLLAMAGCTNPAADTDGTDDTDVAYVEPATCAEATRTGKLAFSVKMLADLIPSMDEPPVGPFLGSVFRTEDADGGGPHDGAEALLDFTIDGLDLSADGGPTAVLFTTGDLPACRVFVLGCLDSDANDCDYHDAITLPNDNVGHVAPDATTDLQITMNLLNPER